METSAYDWAGTALVNLECYLVNPRDPRAAEWLAQGINDLRVLKERLDSPEGRAIKMA